MTDFGNDDNLWPPPSDPMAVARRILADRRHEATGALTLRHWRGGWFTWTGPQWSATEDRTVRSDAYHRVEHAHYRSGKGPPAPWEPTRRKMTDLLEAMSAIALLPSDVQPPSWLLADPTSAAQIISTANGLLDVRTRIVYPHDPRYFNLVSVPFAYDPDADNATEWRLFLASIWQEKEEVQCETALQEWFGYVLSGRLDLDKMLLLPGPTRAGKRVIGEVLSALVGRANVAGVTLARISEQFGLADLVSKPLAIIPDARVGRNSRIAVERLLSISGEDVLNVERKYREDWVGRLPTRVMMLSNELPNFRDASGALANRFITLQLTRSWLHQEDLGLLDRLLDELPSILNWALEGLDRLNENGRFTEPPSSQEATIALIDISSPVAAFVRERCERDPNAEVDCEVLRKAWNGWADDNGHKPGSAQQLGVDLRSVVPGLRVIRPRTAKSDARPRSYLGLRLKDPE